MVTNVRLPKIHKTPQEVDFGSSRSPAKSEPWNETHSAMGVCHKLLSIFDCSSKFVYQPKNVKSTTLCHLNQGVETIYNCTVFASSQCLSTHVLSMSFRVAGPRNSFCVEFSTSLVSLQLQSQKFVIRAFLPIYSRLVAFTLNASETCVVKECFFFFVTGAL